MTWETAYNSIIQPLNVLHNNVLTIVTFVLVVNVFL